MGAKQGQRNKAAGLQRLALVMFGGLLVVLFLIFAVSQGIGQPSVPEGDVVLVEEVPSDIGHISQKDFDRSLLRTALGEGMKKAPEVGTDKYESMKEKALGELIDIAWIEGQSEEMGITATPKQIATELQTIKEQNFPNKGDFEKFVRESKLTKAEVTQRVRLQVLTTQIQQQFSENAPAVSDKEVEDYYEEAKATQYTTPASRDIRIITNADKAKVEAAKKALESDNSPASWKKVAQKYSEDPTTKAKGGLQEGLSEELLASAGPLKALVFDSPVRKVVGVVKAQGKFTVVEVVKVNAEKVEPLEKAKTAISSQLAQQKQQAEFETWVGNYQSRWTARTFCADGFVISRCANYVGGLPANAPPGCFEANPKGGPPAECPAPVTQAAPAVPGSVSILTPTGTRLPQRPLPEGLEEGEGAPGGLEGLIPQG